MVKRQARPETRFHSREGSNAPQPPPAPPKPSIHLLLIVPSTSHHVDLLPPFDPLGCARYTHTHLASGRDVAALVPAAHRPPTPTPVRPLPPSPGCGGRRTPGARRTPPPSVHLLHAVPPLPHHT